MRVYCSVLCLVASALLLQPLNAFAATVFTADMDDTQEVAPGMPGTTTGSATVDLQLNDLGGGNFSLSMQILVTSEFNFSAFGGPDVGEEMVGNLHIHNQVRGMAGDVVWGIFEPDHDVDNDSALVANPDGTILITSEWDMTEGNGTVTLADFLDDLQNAGVGEDVALYLNLHTADAPGGAIRGQLVGVPEPSTTVLLAASLGVFALRAIARRHHRG